MFKNVRYTHFVLLIDNCTKISSKKKKYRVHVQYLTYSTKERERLKRCRLNLGHPVDGSIRRAHSFRREVAQLSRLCPDLVIKTTRDAHAALTYIRIENKNIGHTAQSPFRLRS